MASSTRVKRQCATSRGIEAMALYGALMLACGSPPTEDAEPRQAAEGSPTTEPTAADGPPATASLDSSTLPGSILFISERDDNLEIYRWRAGAPEERVTEDPRADFVVEVAPDGSGWTRVATEDGAVPEAHREQIVWMPRAGDPVLVGPAGRRSREPSWAPDRSFVVFESDAEQAFSDLWRWEPGGALRRLTTTTEGSFEPEVSPDGRSIAFVSARDGNPELYVMAADGTAPRRLTTWRRDDLTPLWSPDGERLAFLRREQGGERLFVLELREGVPPRERRLLPTAEGERVKHADHAWSPDGMRLAYTVHRPEVAPLVAVTEVADGRTRVLSPTSLRATTPSWSPDGRYLVFSATEGDPAALDLYAVRLDDGAWARLTSTAAPDWLPRWTTTP
jgi:TolB protein